MAVAARLFAERGYHPTSVSDIVDAAAVGKGVFYWYFESKEQLFNDILKASLTDLRRRQQAAIGNEPDPVQRMELGTTASMHWYARNRHVLNLFSFAASEDAFAETMRRGQENAVLDAQRHVEDAIARGLVPDADPLIVTHAILGVIDHLVRRFVIERGADPEEIAAAAISFIRSGMLGAVGASV